MAEKEEDSNVSGKPPPQKKPAHKSIPKIPIPGSYLIPRSMCSSTPKPKLPVSEKLL